jgi:hypothetical protein
MGVGAAALSVQPMLGACLAAPEVCEAAVTGGLLVETALGAYEVLSNPSQVLERSRNMSVLDYVSGLDETTGSSIGSRVSSSVGSAPARTVNGL